MTNRKDLQIIGKKRSINLKKTFALYGVPEKKDKGGAFIPKEYKDFCKSKNIEIECSAPRLHTGAEADEDALQTMKNLIITNREDNQCLAECVNRALNLSYNTYGTKNHTV